MQIKNNQNYQNYQESNVFHSCHKDDQEGWLVIGNNSEITDLPSEFHLKPEKVLLHLATEFGNYVTNTFCEYNSFQHHIHFKFLSYDDDTNTAVFQGFLKDDSKFFPWKKEFQITI